MTLPRGVLIAMMALLPVPATAHAFGARYDLPLPLGLYLSAAGLAVALSFGGVLLYPQKSSRHSFAMDIRVLPGLAGFFRVLLASLGLILFAVVIGAAFAGPPEATRNFATIWIWVIWWVGYLLLSALVVETWPLVDPFRRIAVGLVHVRRAMGQGRDAGLPLVFGWLAPIGLLCIAWLEMISDYSEDPPAMGILALIYLGVAIIGGVVFGRPWFDIADPISRVIGVFGRLAPICAPAPGVLRLRFPGSGLLDNRRALPGDVALVVCLIGVVLFDGLSETPAWAAVLDYASGAGWLRPTLLWLREQGFDLLKVIRGLGLACVIGLFLAGYWIVIAAVAWITGAKEPMARLGVEFIEVLLPIAVAYHLAHYISYLLIAGQLILPAASDPFALGWDLFGTRGRSIDISVIGAQDIWWIAFVTVIAGHALSVFIGHRRALQVFSGPRTAAISQVPLTLAMVGLTVLSLWILSQPITQ